MKFNSQSGFTLIELGMVTAVIAILTTIAITSYDKLITNSRMSEAKIHLAAIFSGEMGFFTSDSSFSTCMQSIGFEVAEGTKRYYTVGFNLAKQSDCNGKPCNALPSGGGYCADGEDWWRQANQYAGGITIQCPDGYGCFAGGKRFIAGAAAQPASVGRDLWSIDQSKSINHVQNPKCEDNWYGGKPPKITDAAGVAICN